MIACHRLVANRLTAIHDRGNGMFESLRIRNYRVFDDLEIDDLARINLIGGKNNSGKSSLLEAIFLLAGGGNAYTLMNVNVLRELAVQPISGQQTVIALCRPVFNNLDMNSSIDIEGQYSSHGRLSLKISFEPTHTTGLAFRGTTVNTNMTSMLDLANNHFLKIVYSDANTRSDSRVILKGKEFEIQQDSTSTSFSSTIITSQSGNVQEDATRLGWLRQHKRGDILVKALQDIEPRLKNVEDNSASGIPLIWCDIGLSELVPLAVLGEGMTHVARLVLAIAISPGGVVLVDEIESGIHYSVMSRVWKTIAAAAARFDTQIFATTHSYECIEKAHEGLGADGFRFLRLTSREGINKAVVYEPSVLETAIRHNMEIR